MYVLPVGSWLVMALAHRVRNRCSPPGLSVSAWRDLGRKGKDRKKRAEDWFCSALVCSVLL